MIEIKHLSPYIPYNINGIYNLTDVVSSYKNETRIKVLTSDSCTFFLLYCKPILRPMSDLIPIEDDEINDMVLIKLVNETAQHCDAYDEWRDSYFDNPEPERILQAPYEVFEELLKQHFYVFGLIEKGLAIDINTLENG